MTEQTPDFAAEYEARQERGAVRESYLAQLHEWTEGKHREALEAEPYGPFKLQTPLEVYRDLSPLEREGLEAVERAFFARHQKIARDKSDRLSAWISAGGDREGFERHWREGGQQQYLASRVEEQLEQTRRESIF